MRRLHALRLPSTDGAPTVQRERSRRLVVSPSLCRSLALAGVLALCAQANASATYSFRSGPLTADNANDGSSFTLEFTTPAPLADGVYQWGTNNLGRTNTYIPAGVSFKFTDGYTTLTDPADLSPAYEFTITGGAINQTDGTLGLYAEDPSHYDACYGNTYFYVGEGGNSQLQDVTDPNIVGLDSGGHHIPIAGGTGGTWSYSFTSSVPEPSDVSLLLLGLGVPFATRRRPSLNMCLHQVQGNEQACLP